jgi:hypothetical protein
VKPLISFNIEIHRNKEHYHCLGRPTLKKFWEDLE